MRLTWVDFIYPVLLAGAGLWGSWFYRKNDLERAVDRWMIAFLPTAIFVLVARGLQEMLNSPFQIWDTVRLLPAFLLSKGLPIYYAPDSGPVLDQMYGPMTAVAYLPVTWLVHSPAWAAAIAKILTICYFFGPMIAIAFVYAPRSRAIQLGGYYVLLGALYRAVDSPVLSASGFANHADAPALGLCTLGCLIVFWEKHKEHWVWTFASAVCVILSIWTKQVTAPICLALPLFILLSEGWEATIRYCGALLLAGLAVGTVFVAKYGVEDLWFNLIANPAQEPWQTDLIKIQGLAIVELMERARWLTLAQGAYLLFEFNRGRATQSLRSWLKDNRWALFTLVGTFMVPTSLMGRMKAGGDLNALSFTMYFLLLATLAMVIKIIRSESGALTGANYELIGRKLLLAFVASAVLVELPTVSYSFVRLSRTILRLQTNPAAVAYNYDRKHPGEVYMPWNCLESFLAEGQIYHFEYAIFDRDIARLPVHPTHLRSGIPKNMRYIAYPFNEQARHIMKYFPEYSKQTTLPGLPGWTVYTQP